MSIGTFTFKAPTGGWNTRDPIDQMRSDYALAMINLVPGYKVKARAGFTQSKTPVSYENNIIETLTDWEAANATSAKLLAVTLLSHTSAIRAVWDVSGTNPLLVKNLSCTNSIFNTMQNRNYTYFLSGTEGPYSYHFGTFNELDLTGVGFTKDTKILLVQGCIFNSRAYFVAVNSSSVFYLGLNEAASSTSVASFDCTSVKTRGGTLQWVQPFAKGTGNANQNFLVVATISGEILCWAGTYPADSWSIVWRGSVGKTLGRNSSIHIPGDLLIIAEDGLWSLQRLMSGSPNANVAEQVQDEWIRYANLYGSNLDNYGAAKFISGFYYPKGNYFGVNWPVVPPTSLVAGQFEQFVWNATTFAPTKFTGQNGTQFVLDARNLYFNSGSAIYQADYGTSDNNDYIQVRYQSPFNDLGSPVPTKNIDSARILFQGNKDFNPKIKILTDYADPGAPDPVYAEGVVWTWGDPWGTPWTGAKKAHTKWVGTAGVGYTAAVLTEMYIKKISEFELNSTQLRFKVGGEL